MTLKKKYGKNTKTHKTHDKIENNKATRYHGRKCKKNTKTRKTQAGTHYLGPNIEKHKNTQNTENTFGHSQPHNEPHMQILALFKHQFHFKH